MLGFVIIPPVLGKYLVRILYWASVLLYPPVVVGLPCVFYVYLE